MTGARLLALTASLAGGGLACESGPMRAADYGRELFSDPTFSDSRFNAFACATCHGVAPASAAASPRVGASLYDSAFRRTYWGGYAPRLLDAVNYCMELFMRGAPLDRADPRGRALYEYLVELSPGGELPALPQTIVENVALLPRGSASRGREVYDRACQSCHGDSYSGRGRLDDDIPRVPNTSLEYAAEQGFDAALVVIEKVRHGQFFGVGGKMPPFSLEALSDADLAALVTYLELN